MPRDFHPALLPATTRAARIRSALLSVLAHLAVFAAVGIGIWRAPQIAKFRLPGTPKGLTLLTYYSPGSLHPSPATAAIHRPDATRSTSKLSRPRPEPKSTPNQPPTAEPGTGRASESGAGEGDIRIALSQHSPSPQPDLSVMAHGAKGDVVLDAVIDEHGRITTLTLLQGLAPSIDQEVIATVKNWLFTPATKDGVPVVSEQEFHFHYERG